MYPIQEVKNPFYSHCVEPFKRLFFESISFIPVFGPTDRIAIIMNLLTAYVIFYYYFEIGLVLSFGKDFWEHEFHHPLTILLNCINVVILWIDFVFYFKRGYYE